MLMTSLAEIKSFNPCASGWKAILKGQSKTKADTTLFPLVDCVESNSIADVCWLLGKRKLEIQIAVVFAKACADSVKHLKSSTRAATYAAYAAYAPAAATYATYAADAARGAADAADAARGAADAAQKEKNKQFLRDAINTFRYNEELS